MLKSTDYSYKLQKAEEYYKAGNYARAEPLFDDLINYYKGTNKEEEVSYYYALNYFGQEEYLIAAFQFKSFAQTYPGSDHAEECMFMSAKCYYLLSPDYELDQDYTEKAIEELQLFVNLYPNSSRLNDANDMIDQLHDKLETKAYKAATLYFNMKRYAAASLEFKNILKNYPESKDAEKINFMVVKSNYLYAVYSIENKQQQRYEDAIDSYQFFAKQYPDSQYIEEARNIYNQCRKNLDKIKTNGQDQAQR